MSGEEISDAVCRCGRKIKWSEGHWGHLIGDDQEHQPLPLTHQPPPAGHPNFDYLQKRFEEELQAGRHERESVVENRVKAYDERELAADTLGEWIYSRLRKQGLLEKWNDEEYLHGPPPWVELRQDDRDFWSHEAHAYRRAAARNGFKGYDPEKSKQ